MDVGQEPGNSIEMVENFVTANFSGDERYLYAPLGQQIVCKFPPGHRLRIEQFIRELRATQSSNEHVVGIIRQQIAKWQHTTSDQHVRKLQEHKHFEIIFNTASTKNAGKFWGSQDFHNSLLKLFYFDTLFHLKLYHLPVCALSSGSI